MDDYKEEQESMQKVAIVGLGYVGTILAIFLCEKGFNVYGIDTKQELINKINQAVTSMHEAQIPEMVTKYVLEGRFTATIDISIIKNVDIVLVTVGTPLDEDYTPDMKAIEEVSLNIAKYLRRGHLVMYKSTVVPGITEELIIPILEKGAQLRAGKDFMLAYCPERFSEGSRMTDFEGSALEEVKTLPVIVGGINPQSTNAAVKFWNSLGINTIKITNPKTAELAKLADNWWIDLNIAIANELALLCEKMKIDAYEVIKTANTLPKNEYNVNILLPGCGVGGSCLIKDPWFIYHLGERFGLELKTCQLSREINNNMPKHMYDLVTQALEDIGKRIRNAQISVLGLAFKQSTGDTRNSPAIPLIQLLRNNSAKVKVFDPWVDQKEAKKIAGDCVVDCLEKVLEGSECLALVTAQPEFRGISFSKIKSLVASPCAVVDGRRAFNPKEVISAGFTYWAVGLGKSS